jgi:nucleoside-diphosphate-sugar epimerase
MRYFVTGCTGFIGIHLCRLLISKGHKVYGLVRNPQKIPPDLRGILQVIQGDLKIFQNPALELILMVLPSSRRTTAKGAAISYHNIQTIPCTRAW